MSNILVPQRDKRRDCVFVFPLATWNAIFYFIRHVKNEIDEHKLSFFV